MTATLKVEDLACFRGGQTVFAGVSFRVEGGGGLVIRGANGSGKSSLLRVIAGLMRPEHGSVWLDAGSGAVSFSELGRHSHLVGHTSGLTGAMSALANLRFQTRLLGGEVTRAEGAIARMGLAPFIDRRAQVLSAGQRKRLAMARLLTVPRPLWLLDEPTESLDAAGEAVVETLIAEHCAAGGIALVATHGAAPRAARTELALVVTERLAA